MTKRAFKVKNQSYVLNSFFHTILEHYVFLELELYWNILKSESTWDIISTIVCV